MELAGFMYEAGWFRLEKKVYGKKYLFYGLEVNFCGSYVQIVGKIPYLLAKEIYEFDPRGMLGIKADGVIADKDPATCATSFELEFYTEEYVTEWKVKRIITDELTEKIEKKRSELLKEKPESMYIELYTIDTITGLRVFFEKATSFFENATNCNNSK